MSSSSNVILNSEKNHTTNGWSTMRERPNLTTIRTAGAYLSFHCQIPPTDPLTTRVASLSEFNHLSHGERKLQEQVPLFISQGRRT